MIALDAALTPRPANVMRADHRVDTRPLSGALLLAFTPLLLSTPPRTGLLLLTGAATLVVTASAFASRFRARLFPWIRTTAVAAPKHADRMVPLGLGWALERASDGLLVTDLQGSILHANERVRVVLGDDVRPGATFCGRGVVHAGLADLEAFASVVRPLYAAAEDCGGGEISEVREGQLCVFQWASEPLRDAAGAIVARGFLFHDRTRERELSTLKREFLSTVTHELRTPLTSIKGSLQLILGKAAALSAIERELLAISLKNTDRLIRLINDMLDISQLELGKMDLTFGALAPAPLIEEAIAGLRSYAAGRDIAIGCELEPDLPAIAGDHDRLIQVLTNLISNAVKFSPTGGRVLVHAARAAGELTIGVRDWGVGIRPSDYGRLFQRFQRLNPGGSDEPGTGLGLAISKAIVDRHNGRITVESAEAEGSTFSVVLPLADAAADAASSADAVATDAVRPTILLIDDDADFGTVLEVSLGVAYRFLRVERGVQALDVARAERPDLVLLDVVLPDLNGYDVLRILQHSEATRRIPVVMLTVQPERMLARGLGAADVVAKPVDIEELRRVIDQTLGRVSDAPGLRVALGPLPSRQSAALVAALEAGGHAVFLADDPWDLVRCADEHHPDVAVVETAATGGERTLAFLRGHATTRRLPLVLLTAENAGPLAAGCVSVAPGTKDDELVRRVEEAAGRSRHRNADAEVA